MGKTVLVIDDESGYRDFYKFLLEPLGYRVQTAEDGQQGLEMALKERFDIILLDVHMPKLTGPQVLKRIKEARPDQVVIIFSSSSDSTYNFEDLAKKQGTFECLYKPVEVNDILRIMDQAFKSQGPKDQ